MAVGGCETKGTWQAGGACSGPMLRCLRRSRPEGRLSRSGRDLGSAGSQAWFA